MVYTTLLGVPVAISKHIEGRQVEQSFLGNIADSLQFMRESERFNSIASGLMYIVEGESETRADMDDPIDSGEIVPPVIVIENENY